MQQTGATEKISIAVSGEGQLVKSFTYNDIDENEKTVMKGAKVYNVVCWEIN